MYSLPTTSTTRKAMNIVIESGIIYFVVQFVFVVVYGLNHPSEVILIVIATQTYVRTLLLLVLWPRRKKLTVCRRVFHPRSSFSTSTSDSRGSRRQSLPPCRACHGRGPRAAGGTLCLLTCRHRCRRAPVGAPALCTAPRMSWSWSSRTWRQKRSLGLRLAVGAHSAIVWCRPVCIFVLQLYARFTFSSCYLFWMTVVASVEINLDIMIN